MSNENYPITGEGFLETIQDSCSECLQNSEFGVEESAVDQFVDALIQNHAADLDVKLMDFPLRFDSVNDAVSAWSVMNLINFGSAYNPEIAESARSTFDDTIIRGILYNVLTGKKLDVQWMLSNNAQSLAECLSLTITKEVPVPNLVGVYTHEPSELKGYVDLIVRCLTDAGTKLINEGFTDFGDYFKKKAAAKAFHDESGKPRADKFVHMLGNNFFGFRDVGMVNDKPVYLMRKAQLLARDLQRLYGKEHPDVYDFQGIENLSAFADNVNPSILLVEKILRIPQSLRDSVSSGKPVPQGDVETGLRASTVVAVHKIAEKLREKLAQNRAQGAGIDTPIPQVAITDALVSEVLHTLSKQPKYKSVIRFACRETIHY